MAFCVQFSDKYIVSFYFFPIVFPFPREKVLFQLSIFFLITYFLTLFDMKIALYIIKIAFGRGILKDSDVLLRFF